MCVRMRTRTLILKSLVLFGNFVNVALDVVVLLPHKLYVFGGLLENLRPRSLKGERKSPSYQEGSVRKGMECVLSGRLP